MPTEQTMFLHCGLAIGLQEFKYGSINPRHSLGAQIDRQKNPASICARGPIDRHPRSLDRFARTTDQHFRHYEMDGKESPRSTRRAATSDRLFSLIRAGHDDVLLRL